MITSEPYYLPSDAGATGALGYLDDSGATVADTLGGSDMSAASDVIAPAILPSAVVASSAPAVATASGWDALFGFGATLLGTAAKAAATPTPAQTTDKTPANPINPLSGIVRAITDTIGGNGSTAKPSFASIAVIGAVAVILILAMQGK